MSTLEMGVMVGDGAMVLVMSESASPESRRLF